MRILWMSDSPDTPSGFGNVTRFVCAGLAKRGFAVNILGWQTTEQQEWSGCTVLPGVRGRFGSESLYRALVRIRPDIVIGLGDVWWLPFLSAPHIRRQMELTDTPWALYFPIDGDLDGERIPPSWIDLLREVDVPIAMSRYGQDIARRCGVDCQYIPHGVQLDLFRPPEDRELAKRRIGAAGRFVVLSDSRNQPRKMLPRLLDVFARFAARRPNVMLHLHTDPDDEFARSGTYSYDLRADIRHLGLESCVQFSPGMSMTRGGGLSLERLVEFYQAADVHLLASSGEGFGLPTLQAAAAGAVPMACNYSASAELVAGHGEAIAVADWTENEFGIRRALIDVEDAVRRLERLYDDSRELDERSRRARNFALGYDWQRIIADWDALLREVDGRRRRIARIPPSRVVPLAQLGPSLPYGVDRSAVNVRVVERQLGRLESRILADTCDHYSDVRIPVVLADWTASGVRVARRAGYIGLVRADERIALELRALFPAVSGWVAGVEDGQSDTTTAPRGTFEPISNDDPAVLRLHLASSCLVLHVGAMLSDSLLSDAARFGVPCIGGARSVAQRTLWPDLTVETPERALSLARALLTDASFLRGTVAHARATGESMRSCDDTELIAGLRRSSAALIAAETHAAATG